ncbi:hypothetical protein BN6_13630 [Saccharothrix espanaensis DSM 44229]|uniref:Uncharacterized protein n=1 Tax=Saccharothrix espanaensis (strain ATCC 51144 / DSM 44229 / JCM 9112 / NBRC 15066 / NRRL 15764) TaxID=1179773 RepID=K0JV90_SACES|nr:hypothetical protein BN6_13630 [Saccharothrix espanaensis DSM 44229]
MSTWDGLQGVYQRGSQRAGDGNRTRMTSLEGLAVIKLLAS